MKKKSPQIKTMDINEANKIVEKAQKEGGEKWFDYWNPMDEDLQFIGSSLDVMKGYLEKDDDNRCLLPLLGEASKRVDRTLDLLDKVFHELAEKHRLGPYLPKRGEEFFNLPKVTVEKYKLV